MVYTFGVNIYSMIDIVIKTLDDKEQRYNTVGDYETDAEGKCMISVSKMSDEKFEFLIAIHELIESYLCKERGISDESIDAFDMEYESKRVAGDYSEPGDSPSAPYHREHVFATEIEKKVASELGVDWEGYCRECDKLSKD